MGEEKKTRYALAYVQGEIDKAENLLNHWIGSDSAKTFLEKTYEELKAERAVLEKEVG